MSQHAVGFREVQTFRRNPVAAVASVGLVAGLVGVAWADPSGAGGIARVAVLGLLVGIGLLLWFGELRTEVREDGLYTRMFPLTRQHRFRWDEIQSAEPRSYRPLREYGGWGVRWGRSGKAYNVRGNRGVQLEFVDGRRLLIGSQRAEQLAAAIDQARSARSRS